MLSARRLGRWHGGQVVLDDVTLQLASGDRVGVIGPNGVGKSTLLRILADVESPDLGHVERRPATATVGYLPQEPDPEPGETLGAYLARRTGVAAANADLNYWTDAMATGADAIERYSDALDRFLALGGDGFDARAAEVCADVGLLHRDAADGERARLEQRLDQHMHTLSGGEAARALLAAILLSRFDVLLLDEPTNNLDFAGLDQLEVFIAGFGGAVMVVSHDRVFLDRTVRRVIEIDDHSHRAREYAGGWSEYLDARALARSQQYEAHGKFVAERDRLRERQQTQIGWSESGVRKVKMSGEPDKNVRHAKIARSEKQAGKVKATERRIAQLEVVDKPWEGWRLDLQIQPSTRSGAVVARLEGAVIERQNNPEGTNGTAPRDASSFRLGPIDLEVAWQERIGIVGANGTGKSTLLGGLLGRYPLAEGRRWFGPGVVVGELDQTRGRYAGDEALLKTFITNTELPLSEARGLLAKFALGTDHVDRPGSGLSPGERSRALLAELMAGGVNCLVLDEPTNHLDIEAIEQLEHALAAFQGTIIVVSHDRRFLEAVHLTRVIEL